MILRICLVAVAPLLSVSVAFSAGIGAVYSESQAVPSVALSAGSVLTIAESPWVVSWRHFEYKGNITDKKVLVGTMDPRHDISELKNFDGLTSGANLGAGKEWGQIDKDLDYNGGNTLRVQYKYKSGDGYIKCLILDFSRDSEGNVYAMAQAALHDGTNTKGDLAVMFTYDESSKKWYYKINDEEKEAIRATIASSDSTAHYGIKDISFDAPFTSGGPSIVTVEDNFAVTGSGTAEVRIAKDCVLDLSAAAVSLEAKLLKTGEGAILIGEEMPWGLEVAEGVLVVQPGVAYDMRGVVIGENATVKVCCDGAYCDSLAFSKLDGNTVFLKPAYYHGKGEWDNMDNWLGGTLPEADDAAIAAGEETSLQLVSPHTAIPRLVAVEDGASLDVSISREMSLLNLVEGSSLNVDQSSLRTEYDRIEYVGYIKKSGGYVGRMDPSCGISDLKIIGGIVGGGNMGSYKGKPWQRIEGECLEDGTLRVQFKMYDGTYVKCVIVDFTVDSEGRIYAKAQRAAHDNQLLKGNLDVKFTLDNYTGQNIASADSEGNYGVRDIVFDAPFICGGPSIVTVAEDFVVTGSGTAEVRIAKDCALDLSAVAVSLEAKLLKTGEGAIVIGEEMPWGLEVAEGVLVVQPGVAYDMRGVVIGDGAVVKVLAEGEYRESFVMVDSEGKNVYRHGATYTGNGVWSAAENWSEGAVPVSGMCVRAAGEGTHLVVDSPHAEIPSLISVEGGARLEFPYSHTIASLTLSEGASFNVSFTEPYKEMKHFDYNGFVMTHDTLVGRMDPSLGIEEMENLFGYIGGKWISPRKDGPLYYDVSDGRLLEDGLTYRVQFKMDDGNYTKCVIVDFRKDDDGNIYARGYDAAYSETRDLSINFEDKNSGKYKGRAFATSNDQPDYGVSRVVFDAPQIRGGPAVVAVKDAFSVMGSSPVKVDVAEGSVLDLSEAEISMGAELVKTGGGAIAVGARLPQKLTVTEGVLALQPLVEYDMALVTLGEGVAVKVVVGGELKDAISIPQENGKTLFVAEGVYIGAGTWTEHWVNDTIPGVSGKAYVYGEGTVLTVDSMPEAMPEAIVVEGGASLVAGDGVSLPEVTLASRTSMTVAPGARVTLGGLTCAAKAADDLPVLTVSPGGTLVVPAGQKFSNVRLVLCDGAALTESGNGPLVFGYAEEGKTAYFSMHATNAVITALAGSSSSSANNSSSISFVAPNPGGTVVVDGDIILKGCTIAYNQYDGFSFGVGNPVEQHFRVVADGTDLEFGADTYVSGGANLVLTNNSVLFRRRMALKDDSGNNPANIYSLYVNERGRITLVDGGEICANITRMDYDFQGAIRLDPEEAGYCGIEILEGGIGCWYKTYSANKNGAIYYRGGMQRVFCGYRGDYRKYLFNRLGELHVAEGSVMTLCGVADLFNDSGWNLGPFEIEAPFAGAGDVVVTNTASGSEMQPVIVKGSNTCSGTIGVAQCDEGVSAVLHFANGANWAGTVVANGRISLVDTVKSKDLTHSSPVSVSFGALDLRAPMPLRVWREGEDLASDKLNVGMYINGGGRIVPVMATGGESFGGGDSFVAGRISKASPLPDVPSRFKAVRREIAGNDSEDELVLKFVAGFIMIVR